MHLYASISQSHHSFSRLHMLIINLIKNLFLFPIRKPSTPFIYTFWLNDICCAKNGCGCSMMTHNLQIIKHKWRESISLVNWRMCSMLQLNYNSWTVSSSSCWVCIHIWAGYILPHRPTASGGRVEHFVCGIRSGGFVQKERESPFRAK